MLPCCSGWVVVDLLQEDNPSKFICTVLIHHQRRLGGGNLIVASYVVWVAVPLRRVTYSETGI